MEKCTECDSTEDIINGLCANCEENCVWCEVCKEQQHRQDSGCRHIFWTDCGYAGAGTHETDWKDIKEDFFKALDALAKIENPDVDDHPNLITGLLIEIGRHRFWDQEHGAMLSTPDLAFYRECPDLAKYNDGKVISLTWARLRSGDFATEDLNDDEVANGMQWLASLCCGETKAANRETVKWIREWMMVRATVALSR